MFAQKIEGSYVPVLESDVRIKVLSPKDARKKGLQNWSLAPIQSQDDVSRNHALAMELRITLRSLGICRAYAPQVTPASAVIVSTSDLKDRIRLAGDVSLFRKEDTPADGVFLKCGEAFVMSSAGCPVIIATGGGFMIVANAGRDSLIDRGAVLGRPTRKHVSVVDAILEALKERGVPAERVTMRMIFSIPTMSFEHRFDHETYGEYNLALCAFIDERWSGCMAQKTGDSMFLSLESVFVEQACKAGLRKMWATHSLDNLPELAHTRDGKDPRRRNLIIVKREA